MREWFHRFAEKAERYAGSPSAFFIATAMVLVWLATGPAMRFTDTWQFLIDTPTNIITFLMVFVLQTSQNRNQKALHLKLDELIRVSTARNAFVGLEKFSEDQIAELQREFDRIAKGDER
jgi:low affinity Fe/Cu permease